MMCCVFQLSNPFQVIHCLRNPKDVACSAFPFLKRMGVLVNDTTWEQFLDLFTGGKSKLYNA